MSFYIRVDHQLWGNHKGSSYPCFRFSFLLNYNFGAGVRKMIGFFAFLFTFSFGLFTYEGCSNPAAPVTSTAGPRNYTWTVDTIKTMDPLTLTRIWGISPTDVWAVGSTGSPALTIWHYNGSWWGCDSVGRPFYPWAIIGFSSNEVWLGNTNSTIWKYNGSQWQQYNEYDVAGYDKTWIMNFDGTASNNIYAVGSANKLDGSDYRGTIMHYDGISWKFANIPYVKVGFTDGKIDQSSGALIIEGTVFDTTGFISKIHSWDGNQLKELYSGIPYAGVGSVQHEVLVYINQKIYKYENGQLVVWKDLSGTDYSGKIWCGRSENDFFMGSSVGVGIGHYNGTDFQIIYKFKTNLDIYGAYIFDKDVFFLLKLSMALVIIMYFMEC